MIPKFLRFILLISLFKRYICEEVLLHENELQFGKWFFWNLCPAGAFATAFEIKADKEEKNFSDEQGMTSLRLVCMDRKNDTATEEIASMNVHSGSWKGKQICLPGNWLIGFRIRIQKYGGWVRDDTGANNLEMSCSGSNATLNGGGTDRGDWTPWYYCPEGEAICGLRTKVEDTFTADKAGIIAINLMCCNLTGESRTSVDPNFFSTPSTFENELFGPSSNGSTFFNSTFSNNAPNSSFGSDSFFNRSSIPSSSVNRTETPGGFSTRPTDSFSTNSSSPSRNVNRTTSGGVSTQPSNIFTTTGTFVSDGQKNNTGTFNDTGTGVDDFLREPSDSKKPGSKDEAISFPEREN